MKIRGIDFKIEILNNNNNNCIRKELEIRKKREIRSERRSRRRQDSKKTLYLKKTIPRTGGKCCLLASKLLGTYRNRVESASKQLFGY